MRRLPALSRRLGRLGLVALALVLVVGVAVAQQVLDFKPVPPESAARFERMRVVKRSRATAIRESLDAIRRHADVPDEADEPDVPDVPDTPEPVHGRSGSVMRIGSDIVVGKDEVVEGDISSVNGDISVEGHVRGDVVAMRGDVHLASSARVDGDVVCIGGTLEEEPGAVVLGQRVTAPGSRGWADFARRESGESHGDGVAHSLVRLLLGLLFAWVLVRFAPDRTRAAVETVRRQSGLSLGIGALVWALIIPSVVALCLVVALLCITIIGIPLALAALVGYGLFLLVLCLWGSVVGAIVLGGALSHRSSSQVASPTGPPAQPSLMRQAMIGVLALQGSLLVGDLLHSATSLGAIRGLGTLLMVLGWVAIFLATTMGAGALLRAEFVAGTVRRWWAGRRSGSSGTPATPVAPSPAPPPAPPAAVAPPPSPEVPPAPPLG